MVSNMLVSFRFFAYYLSMCILLLSFCELSRTMEIQTENQSYSDRYTEYFKNQYSHQQEHTHENESSKMKSSVPIIIPHLINSYRPLDSKPLGQTISSPLFPGSTPSPIFPSTSSQDQAILRRLSISPHSKRFSADSVNHSFLLVSEVDSKFSWPSSLRYTEKFTKEQLKSKRIFL